MGSNSLESGARLTSTTDNYGTAADLDDSLIHQALSVYQASRADDSGMINCFPTNQNHRNIEITIDLPNDGGQRIFSPNDQQRRSHTADSGDLFTKPYNCSAINRFDPPPIDERIVSCSARVRVEQVPTFGCSTRIKIDIDAPDFYLCSAHIKLRPEPDSYPPGTYLCSSRDWENRPKQPPDIYMCVSHSWDKPGQYYLCVSHSWDKPGQYYLCVSRPWEEPGHNCFCTARIDTQQPRRSDIDLCVARIDTRQPRHSDIDLCVARIDTRQPRHSDIDLCVSRIDSRHPQHSDIDLCAAKVRWSDLQDPSDDPDTMVIGCGKKVPGEPGFYRMCSASAPKDYIPEFLEYEKQARTQLDQELQDGRISLDQYKRATASWNR